MGKSGGVDKERWRGAGGVTERGGVERTSGERSQDGESPGGSFSRTGCCCSDGILGTRSPVGKQLPNLQSRGTQST